MHDHHREIETADLVQRIEALVEKPVHRDPPIVQTSEGVRKRTRAFRKCGVSAGRTDLG
jgi:hypothetical protein